MFPSLDSTISTIEEALSANERSLTRLATHYDSAGARFDSASKSLSEIGGAGDEFLPFRSFGFAAQALQLQLAGDIRACASEYARRGADLLRALVECRDSLLSARARRDEKRARYADAGSPVAAAHRSGSRALTQTRDAFARAQREAAAAHTEYRRACAALSTRVEELLCDFESLERWRASEAQSILRVAAVKARQTGALFVASSNEISASAGDRCAALRNCAYLRRAAASPRYQIVPVPAVASAHLDMSAVWRDELSSGARLGSVRESHRSAGSGELDAREGEVVLILGECDGALRCRNINDCEGTLPVSAVASC